MPSRELQGAGILPHSQLDKLQGGLFYPLGYPAGS